MSEGAQVLSFPKLLSVQTPASAPGWRLLTSWWCVTQEDAALLVVRMPEGSAEVRGGKGHRRQRSFATAVGKGETRS